MKTKAAALVTTSTPKWQNGLVIQASGCRFAVPLKSVYGVVHAIEPVPIARPPRNAVEVHGRTWDVIDLVELASRQSREFHSHDPFVLVSHGGRDLALWAERNHGLIGYCEDDWVAADVNASPFVAASRVLHDVAGFIFDLDLDSLIAHVYTAPVRAADAPV